MFSQCIGFMILVHKRKYGVTEAVRSHSDRERSFSQSSQKFGATTCLAIPKYGDAAERHTRRHLQSPVTYSHPHPTLSALCTPTASRGVFVVLFLFFNILKAIKKLILCFVVKSSFQQHTNMQLNIILPFTREVCDPHLSSPLPISIKCLKGAY